MIFLFFDNFVAYLYVNHSLSPEKQDYDMKRQEWLQKGRKTEKKEKKTENRTDGCTDPSDAFGDCISDRLESIHGGKRRGGGE